MKWSSIPESSYFPRFKKFGIPKHNKCRNPNKDGKGAWCFIEKSVWKPYYHTKIIKEYCAIERVKRNRDCDIGCLDEPTGIEYNGKASISTLGYVCQKWNVNYPNYVQFKPNEDDINHNYCRNPNFDPRGPWCYAFSHSFTKVYCSIPMCNAAPTAPPTTTIQPTVDDTTTTKAETRTAVSTSMASTTRTLPKNLPKTVKCGEPVFALPKSVIRKTTDLASRYTSVGVNVYAGGTASGLNRSKRIYGGKKPTHGSMPWLVSLILGGEENDNQFRCGGAIIGKHFVVTAAHCTKGRTASEVVITAGAFTSQ